MANHPEVLRIGYVGSYARGDWGVGSDLDLIMVVEHADSPWELRSASWDTTTLPVPADLIVYTENEWNALDPDRPFTQVLGNAVVWLTGC